MKIRVTNGFIEVNCEKIAQLLPNVDEREIRDLFERNDDFDMDDSDCE